MKNTITFNDLLKRWKKEAGIKKDVSLFSNTDGCLIICTRYPDLYIGKNEELSEKYLQMIENCKTDKGEKIIQSPFGIGELYKIRFIKTFYKI